MAKRGGFPGGMPGNMNNLMKQAQKMQRQMEEAQQQLEEQEVTIILSGVISSSWSTVSTSMSGHQSGFSMIRLVSVSLVSSSLHTRHHPPVMNEQSLQAFGMSMSLINMLILSPPFDSTLV